MGMSIIKLIPIDPNNIKHIELMESFEKTQETSTPIGKYKLEQKEENINQNDISMELVLEEKSNALRELKAEVEKKDSQEETNL